MGTRRKINETAANLVKLLTMITRMPDNQIDYIINRDLVNIMHATSEKIMETL